MEIDLLIQDLNGVILPKRRNESWPWLLQYLFLISCYKYPVVLWMH